MEKQQDTPLWQTLIAKIRAIENLPDGWDSYNAKRIPPQVIETTKTLFEELATRKFTLINVDPTPNESVVIKALRRNTTVELEIDADGEIGICQKIGISIKYYDFPNIEAVLQQIDNPEGPPAIELNHAV